MLSTAVTPIILRINQYIINPLILLGLTWAVLMFFWGLYQFIRNTDSDEGRETGKANILYGVIGMFIMVSVYGIINLVLNMIGVSKPAILP